MTTTETYDKSLNRFYDAIDRNYDNRNNTKKWCLTLWLATIAFLGSNGRQIEMLPAVCLSYVPILAFWFLEATQGAFGKILIDKTIEMERLLISEWDGIESPGKYLYISGRHAQIGTKTRATLYAAFLMETVVTFYILLIVVSPTLIYFMRS